MQRRLTFVFTFLLVSLLGSSLAGYLLSSKTAEAQTADTTPKIVAATNAFLATLDETQRSTVLFDFTDTAQKQSWSNFPEGLYNREGLQWASMTSVQREAWLNVMATTLSKEGYDRVIKEWNADEVLALEQASGGSGNGGGAPGGAPGGASATGTSTGAGNASATGTVTTGGSNSGGNPGGGGMLLGTQYYFIAIIGTPSATTPWQWQWGGHHVTINATIVGSNLSLTPSFIGDQPAAYTDVNGNVVRPLGDIEDEAFALINALDTNQKSQAVLGSTGIDLVLGPGEDGKVLQNEGLPASAMNASQQAMLLKLIGHYTGLANDEDAAARMADIKSHLANTYLVWYGPTTAGSSAYFRIQGPTIVIEYSPQGNGVGAISGGNQGGANGTPGAGNGTPGAGAGGNGTPGAGGPGGNGGGSSATAVANGPTPGAGAVGTPGTVSTAAAVGPDHIHGIYRDPTNDYGAAFLLQAAGASTTPAASGTTTTGSVAPTEVPGIIGGTPQVLPADTATAEAGNFEVTPASTTVVTGMPVTGAGTGGSMSFIVVAALVVVLAAVAAGFTLRRRA